MASMDAIDVLQQQLIAAAHNDLLAPMASDEIDADDIKKMLLAGYAEELSRQAFEEQPQQVCLVAGGGGRLQ